jgi:hypothetical protein
MEREGAPLGRERVAKCKERADKCPTTPMDDKCEVFEDEEGATSQEVGCPL